MQVVLTQSQKEEEVVTKIDYSKCVSLKAASLLVKIMEAPRVMVLKCQCPTWSCQGRASTKSFVAIDPDSSKRIENSNESPLSM